MGQDVLGRDFTYDAAKVIRGFPEVLGKQVGREVGVNSLEDSLDRGHSVFKGLVMAKVGDIGLALEIGKETLAEFLQSVTDFLFSGFPVFLERKGEDSYIAEF